MDKSGFMWQLKSGSVTFIYFPSVAPEESSLDIGPAHVDAHVAGLVHQDVVLGAGGQPVAEPHPLIPGAGVTRGPGQGHWWWEQQWLSFCAGLQIWLQPWTLLWWDAAVIPILRQTIIHRLKHRNLHNYRDPILDAWYLPDNAETGLTEQWGPHHLSMSSRHVVSQWLKHKRGLSNFLCKD